MMMDFFKKNKSNQEKSLRGVFTPLKSFFHLSLSLQIVLSIIFGFCFGIVLRYNPNLLNLVGLSAASFQQLGNLFIKMVKLIAMPLIFTCIMQSIISLCRKTSTGKVTVLTIFVFICMTVVSIATGAAFTIFFKPGANATFDLEGMLAQYSDNNLQSVDYSKHQFGIADFILNIVPSNIFVSFYHNNSLQIIFFAILLSIGITKIDKKGNIYHGIKTLSNVFMEAVQVVMKFAPFGTFGISVWLVATQNIDLLKSLGKLICVDWLCAFAIIYVIYSLTTLLILRLNPIFLWKKLFSTQLIAFLTASSGSTLPLGMEVAKEKLGVSEEKVNFIAPFSAAINSSGGATYFTIITIFMAQLLNIDLTVQQYATLFIVSALCDLGVAPVPSGSLIMLGNVFMAVGIPVEALGIAFAVDRILDMARTLLNYTGDIYSALVVDKLSGTMNVKRYSKSENRYFFFKKSSSN